ncbi:hypothetical protein [Intrasporangium calvum]|uniref:hypothetical protein n=1 Tax=Intrasporangium calvum TaxID=53358 RepID=UPI000DF60CB5|nr:hypothetical protein [Intrasporangium calvum]AXG14970.1 hypothetical protein DN585_17540 [Intrasporangium calvum]
MRHTTQILLAVAAAAALAGCAPGGDAGTGTPTASPSTPAKTPIQAAAIGCHVAEANVGDAGKSISFDTKGEDYSDTGNDKITDLVCVLTALRVPDHVIAHMDSTRALDGQQEDTWDSYKARWTYHPDDGLNLTVFVK